MPHNGKTLNVSPATSKNLKIIACGAKLCRHTTKCIVPVLVPLLLLMLVVLVLVLVLINIDSVKRPVQLGIAYADVKALKKFSSLVVPLNIHHIAGFGHFWSNLEFVFGK
jgi:hypothetical protein